jgi:hypothetical protein
LPYAPRPDIDTPAPVRFLPEYDNLLLGHADRSRMGTTDVRAQFERLHGFWSAFLVDGVVAGAWRQTVAGGASMLTVRPFYQFGSDDSDAVALEAQNLHAFLNSGAASRELQVLEPDIAEQA